MPRYELEVQHKPTEVGEYSIFKAEIAGGTCKETINNMIKGISDNTTKKPKKRRKRHRK